MGWCGVRREMLAWGTAADAICTSLLQPRRTSRPRRLAHQAAPLPPHPVRKSRVPRRRYPRPPTALTALRRPPPAVRGARQRMARRLQLGNDGRQAERGDVHRPDQNDGGEGIVGWRRPGTLERLLPRLEPPQLRVQRYSFSLLYVSDILSGGEGER